RYLLHATANPGPPGGDARRHRPSRGDAVQHPRARGPYLGQLRASRVHDRRGHERCREGMLAAGLTAQAFFPGVEWGDIVLRPPSVTFADRLTLWVDDLRLEARHVGPAHRTGDAVLWLPERGCSSPGTWC